jgi:hypothetical protein
MTSEHMTLQTVGRSATRRTLHWPLGADRVSMPAALIQRITGALTKFAAVPVLPHATLREASMVVAFVDGADRVDSDSLPDRTSLPGDDGFWSRF